MNAIPKKLPQSVDFADVSHDSSIRAAIRQAGLTEQEPPRPLRRPIREAEPYPVDQLGSLLGAAVKGAHDIIQAPLSICAQSALSHAALAVQAHANVALPIGHEKPLSLFLLSVASSGDRKSAVDKELGWALNKHERNLADALAGAKAEFANDREAFEAARATAKAKAGKDGGRAAIVRALDEVGTAPVAPLDAIISFPEPTLEGLHKYLAIGQPSMGLFSDEGGMFVGGVGMSKENALKSAAGFSQLWDGAPVKRLRSLDGATVLFGRRVSLHLMLQPDAATAWLADPVLRDQGIFSRLLIAAPASLAGTRMYREPTPETRPALARFGARVLSIFEREYALKEGEVGELDPRPLRMTDGASRMWFAFADAIEGGLGPNGKLRPISGLAGKIPEHAARLAAVLALFDDIEVPELDERALTRGINLSQWYLGEALRLAEAGHVSDDVRLAEAALDWLHNRWPLHEKASEGGRLIAVPDLYQLGPYSIRTKEAANCALGILEAHGWVEKLPDGKRVRGVLRKDVYTVKEGPSDGRG